jgi:hypothetical protein
MIIVAYAFGYLLITFIWYLYLKVISVRDEWSHSDQVDLIPMAWLWPLSVPYCIIGTIMVLCNDKAIALGERLRQKER